MLFGAIRRPPQPDFDLETELMRAFFAIGIKTQDRAAQELGIPATQFGRQIKSVEHLSFQRLLTIKDARFWVSLLGSLSAYAGTYLAVDSGFLRRDVMRLLIQLNRFSVSMLKRDQPVSERKRA